MRKYSTSLFHNANSIMVMEDAEAIIGAVEVEESKNTRICSDCKTVYD